jgi:hypothetical protein
VGTRASAGLYGTWFQNFFTQGVNGPVDGFLLDHFQMQDIITVAPDRQSAKGRFRGLLMGGSHESREYKPEGLPLQFFEAGVYENDYVREGGVWKVKRLDYMMQWQADYENGWSKTVSQPAAGHADLPGESAWTGRAASARPDTQDLAASAGCTHALCASSLRCGARGEDLTLASAVTQALGTCGRRSLGCHACTCRIELRQDSLQAGAFRYRERTEQEARHLGDVGFQRHVRLCTPRAHAIRLAPAVPGLPYLLDEPHCLQ